MTTKSEPAAANKYAAKVREIAQNYYLYDDFVSVGGKSAPDICSPKRRRTDIDMKQLEYNVVGYQAERGGGVTVFADMGKDRVSIRFWPNDNAIAKGVTLD